MTTLAAARPPMTTGYAQVVMPIDFSPLSWKALPLATTMHEAFGVPRRLVHVDTSSPWRSEHPHELALRTGPHGRHVQVEVVAARTVPDGLARVLGPEDDSLLVMSSHGMSAAAELRLGSTTEAMLRHRDGPTVLVGPRYRPAGARVTRMVLCVDPGSAPPPALVDDVAKWAWQFDAPVDVLAVHERTQPADLDEIRRDRERLEEAVESLRAAGIKADPVPLRGGRVAHDITSYADARPGSVIALAPHARTLPARMLLGSVATAVLRHASSPVLLRRHRDDAS